MPRMVMADSLEAIDMPFVALDCVPLCHVMYYASCHLRIDAHSSNERAHILSVTWTGLDSSQKWTYRMPSLGMWDQSVCVW